jgi:predicted dehydrogenase
MRKDNMGELRPVRTAGFFTAHLSLAGGLEVQMTDTPTFGNGAFTVALYGTRGELHYDAHTGLQAAFLGGGGLQPVSIDPDSFRPARREGSVFRKSFDLFAPHLVAAVRSGDPAHVRDAARFADAVPTQRVLDAIRESAITGGTVELAGGYEPGARF